MMVSISEIVTPYTLKELFHSALPWEYNVYVPRARRSNCVATNILTQGQYLNRHGSGLLKQKIQRVHTFTHTRTSNSPTRIPLVVGYHQAIQSISSIFTKSYNTFTFSHTRNFLLLCLNIYLSLPSYVLTRRKSAKWTSRSEPELSINVMVLLTVQSPQFSRKIAVNEHYKRPCLAWTT